MLKDEIIVLAFWSAGCNDAISPWCCNDCAFGVVLVVMNILFKFFIKIKSERV